MGTLRRVARLSSPGRGRIAASVALGTVAMLCGVALLTASGYLISRAAERPPILALSVAIVTVRFFGLARPLARYADRLWSHDVALRSLTRVRARFVDAIEPLAPAELDGYRRGDLLTRMLADVDGLQGLQLRGTGPLLVAVATGAVCVAGTAIVLPAAAVVLAAGLLTAIVIVPAIGAALSRAAGRRQVSVRADLTSDLLQLFRAAPELVVNGGQGRALEGIAARDHELASLSRRNAILGGAADALSVLVAGATVAGVLAVSTTAHAAGTLDRTLIITLALLALGAFEAAAALPAAARELSATLTGGKRVLEILDRRPSVEDPPAPCPAPACADISIQDVTARYGDDLPPAVAGLTLDLPAGRRVAVTGASGAGKTTVANLLLRFLDPEQGCVRLDGRDLREYRQHDVRAMFAYAGQDAHIFDSSIRANLELGRAGASDADLEAALAAVRMDAWVAALPDGMDTRVGDDGAALSGGQRQRLGIARALLSDAPVLLLDEPAAHLDHSTAEAVIGDILRTSGDRSVLLITHRPEGRDLVDEILELADGAVVDRVSSSSV